MKKIRTKPLEDDGSSCIKWAVFHPDVTDTQIEETFPEPDGREIHSMYDCTGKAFAYPITVRRTKTRTLVKQ
jgi:hypothetical protein